MLELRLKFKGFAKKGYKEIIPIVFLLLISILFHSMFVFKDHNLVVNMDAINQFPFFYIHLLESFAEGNFFWSWSYGLGGDLWGEFAYYYATSPLFYAIVLAERIVDFDWDILNVVTLKLYLSVLKSFLGMLGMYLLIRYEKFERWKAVISAVIFGSAIIFFTHAAIIDYLTETFIYVPLTIFGLLYYQRTGKSRFFILGIFLSLFSNYYMGFINSIFYGLAALILTPLKQQEHESLVKSLYRTYAPYALHYMIGLGLAFVGFLPGILTVRDSDRMSLEPIIPALFDGQWFLRLPEQIWSDIGHLGFPIITIIILLLVTAAKDDSTKRKSILALTMFVFYFIPYMYSVFNGFSAIQYRWFHILNFAVAFAIPNWLTLIMQQKRISYKHIILLGIVGLIILYTKQERIGTPVDIYDLGVAGFGLLSLLFLYLMTFQKWQRKSLLAIFLVLSVSANAVINILGYSEEQILGKWGAENLTDEYFDQYSLDSPEEKEIFTKLVPQKEEFYRTQYSSDHRLNHSMLYGYYGGSAYNSVIKKNINTFVKSDFNVLQRNPLGNGIVVVTYSLFDQRWALETGLGVKYQVLPKDVEPPYNYRVAEETEQYFVYEHNSPVGLDMWYTETISESAWHQLNPAQRDALFLNTVVVSDEIATPQDESWRDYLPEEIPLTLAGLEYNNASYEDGILTVGENGVATLPIQRKSEAGEYLVYLDVSPVADKAMRVNVNGKETLKRESQYIYNYDNEGYVFQVSGQTSQIDIKLPPGDYQLSTMQVYWNSYEEFQKQTELREVHNLEDLVVDGHKLSGNISVAEDGILFLSMPYSKGWKLKVNGKEEDIQVVQSSFTGIPLEAGSYKIEMSYKTPGLNIGLWISLLSLLGAFSLYFFTRKTRNSIK